MTCFEKPGTITRREWIAALATAPLLAQSGSLPAPDAELIELAAGPLTLAFQPDIAFVRYVRLGDREVVRGVYSAVRNNTWGTVAPRVSNLKVERKADSFDVSFHVDCVESGINFAWDGKLTGAADGMVRFAMNGIANSDFERNRIGFCVLHPMRECAGQPCTVEQVDGQSVQGRFPDLISPHQPFKNIRAISHEIVAGTRATVRFEGDTFEMEDHRNWTDSNYKTYCTPLEIPYPVRVAKGTRIAQAVTLSLTGKPAAARARRSSNEPVRLSRAGEARPLPQIGFGLNTSAAPPTNAQIAQIRALRPAHLRVDLDLGSGAWKAALAHAAAVSGSLDAPLECAVTVTANAGAELSALAAEVSRSKPNIARWYVFHAAEASTSPKWIELARKHLPRGAKLGAGTNQFFTELNRGRPQTDLIDVVCYSINPQVHAFDNRSIVENLEAQADTVRTARSFSGKLPVAVTPVTLKPRSPRPQADPRQKTLLGAGWTLGSIKYLAESGADFVTYYELTGDLGLMDREVFPLYQVFKDIAGMQQVLPMRSSDPLRVEALLLKGAGGERLILANLTGQPQRVMAPKGEVTLAAWSIRTVA